MEERQWQLMKAGLGMSLSVAVGLMKEGTWPF